MKIKMKISSSSSFSSFSSFLFIIIIIIIIVIIISIIIFYNFKYLKKKEEQKKIKKENKKDEIIKNIIEIIEPLEPLEPLEIIENIPTLTSDSDSASTITITPTLRITSYDSIPSSSTWPNYPLLIRRSPSMFYNSKEEVNNFDEDKKLNIYNITRPLQIHNSHPDTSIINIDTELFQGQMYLVIAGLRDSPNDFFRTKRRLFEVIVQGRFKKEIPFSQVYTGQIFSQSFSYLPPTWLIKTIISLLSKIQPALQLSLNGDSPYLISPLASTAKHMMVHEIGNEPPISGLLGNCDDNLSLLNSNIFQHMSSNQRCKYFSNRENLLKYFYSPNYVYTFDFYQHVFNIATMKIDIGITTLDVLKIIGFVPVQIMSVFCDPVESPITSNNISYLYNVEIWHEKCCKKEKEEISKES